MPPLDADETASLLLIKPVRAASIASKTARVALLCRRRYETPLHNNINQVGIPVDTEIDCPASRDAATCDV